MEITAELDVLRSEVDGCAVVAYTDLSSQLVLSTSAATNPIQEEMNALSQAAHLALEGAFAAGATPSWGGAPPAQLAVLATGAEARLFLRSPANADEALIAVCAPDVDLEVVVNKAQATLQRINSKG